MEILQIITSQQASKQGALSEGTVIYGVGFDIVGIRIMAGSISS